MALRHKRIVSTLDTGGSADWNDDHISDFTDEILLEYNFITPAITTNWDLTVGGAGVAPVITFQDHHCFVKLDSGANNGDYSCMKHEFNGAAGNITDASDAPIFTSAVWMDTYAAAGKTAEFGFLSNATAPFTANQSGAYFRINADVLYAITGNGAAETAVDITPIGGIPEYGCYRIELTSSNCKFYVDDMDTASATATLTLPTGDLTLAFAARNNAGTKTEMYVDGVGLTRKRYTG